MAKPRRVPKEFLGAFQQGHRADVREFIDDEFSYELLSRLKRNPYDQEARDALLYLARFNNEKYRGVLKKGDPQALHRSPMHYREATNGRNEQKRDLISAANARKSVHGKGRPYVPVSLVWVDSVEWTGVQSDSKMAASLRDTIMNRSRDLNHEDTLIECLDRAANYHLGNRTHRTRLSTQDALVEEQAPMIDRTPQADFAPPAEPEQINRAPEPEAISAELQSKLDTLRAFAKCHNVITVGSFPFAHSMAAMEAVQFLKSVYAEALLTIKAHPQAHLIPELNIEKEVVHAQTA